MVILIAQHRLRRHYPAPESTRNIILSRPLPYRAPEVHARSLPAAISVSAGVSRKRVHLFRWGSYFHKAFTGTKKTTSRERLPNPSSQCRNVPFRSRARAKTSCTTDIDTIRTVDMPPFVLINRRYLFLRWSPEPFGPCPPSRPKPVPRHYPGIDRGWKAPLRTPRASNRITNRSKPARRHDSGPATVARRHLSHLVEEGVRPWPN